MALPLVVSSGLAVLAVVATYLVRVVNAKHPKQ